MWGHYGCHWCGEKGIEGHQSWHCPSPHHWCHNLGFGRCVVPSYHSHYHPHQVAMDDPNYCPYHRDNQGKAPPSGMPRRNRLKYGNGPRVFARDSGTRGLGRATDEIGEAGLAIEAKTDQCEGGGTGHQESFHRRAVSPCEDSRLNSSWIGLQPSLGGDVTTLTPFSFFPMTDISVGCLPELFLAYCYGLTRTVTLSVRGSELRP